MYMPCLLAAIVLCAHSPKEASPFRASRRLVRLLDGHFRNIPGRLSTQQLIQGVSKLAAAEWPDQPLKKVSLTSRERESLRRAARASVLASAAYSTFGVLLVAWTRSPLQVVQTLWWMLCGLHQPHRTAFNIHTRALGLHARDVLHAQWRPRLMDRQGERSDSGEPSSTSTLAAYVPAHYIVVDHHERAVVLVVRGTLALEDMVTAFEVAPTRSDERELGRHCHGGMAAAARTLVEQHKELLRSTLEMHPGYRLDLAGHSLGAGIASFATVLLRRSLPRGIAVHAYAFAPPCTLPLRESRRHDSCVDAYIYQADVVPRLSVGSVHGLSEAIAAFTGDSKAYASDATDGCYYLRKASRPQPTTRFPPGRLRQLEWLQEAASESGDARGRRRGGGSREHQLLCPDRRGLGLIRLRRSMFRDHGFDRYECALTDLAGSCSTTHGEA